jgi:hypothetical protein
MSKFTHSGNHAVIVDKTGIRIVDTANGSDKLLVDNTNIGALDISPKDTYLITCEKYNEG